MHRSSASSMLSRCSNLRQSSSTCDAGAWILAQTSHFHNIPTNQGIPHAVHRSGRTGSGSTPCTQDLFLKQLVIMTGELMRLAARPGQLGSSCSPATAARARDKQVHAGMARQHQPSC